MARIICNILIFVLIPVHIQAQGELDSINQLNDQSQRIGLWEIYYEDGAIKEYGTYINGNKDGLWKSYYPDGKLKHEITYKKGAAIGPARFYYKDGTLWEEGYWNKTHWTGDYNLYHASGGKYYEWHYNEEGQRTGTQKYYHENGQLMYTGEWQNGSIRGDVKVFNEAGELMEKRQYTNGSFQNSKVITARPASEEENSEREILPFYGTGNYTLQSLDGLKIKEGYFRDGVLQDGKHYIYNKNDSLIKVKTVENGKYTD